jgi:regulator of RNase E activity RraA
MNRTFKIADGIAFVSEGSILTVDADGYFKEAVVGDVWYGTAGEDLIGRDIYLLDGLLYNAEVPK